MFGFKSQLHECGQKAPDTGTASSPLTVCVCVLTHATQVFHQQSEDIFKGLFEKTFRLHRIFLGSIKGVCVVKDLVS